MDCRSSLLPLPVTASLIWLTLLPALLRIRLSLLRSRLSLCSTAITLTSLLWHHAALRHRLHLRLHRLSSLPATATLPRCIRPVALRAAIPTSAPRRLRQRRRHLVVRDDRTRIHRHHRTTAVLPIELLPVLHHLLTKLNL